MFLFSTRAIHVRYVSFFICLLSLTVFVSSTVRAQMGGIDNSGDPGTGGKSTIQGSVYLPSGQRVNRRLRVTLSSSRGIDISTLTDDNGSFSFRRLAEGSYTVTVDAGKEYETASERVNILQPLARRGTALGQNYTVQIQLQFKRSNENKPSVINAALAGVPKPALDLYQKALLSAQAGDSSKAIEQLKGAISVDPEFMLAFNEMGSQYLRLGQLDKAADAFRSALKITPDAFEPLLNYGIVLVYMKQLKEAEPILRRAVEMNDGSAVAHYFLGRTLAVSRKFDEAEKELQRAIGLGGNSVDGAHRYLGAIYKERHEYMRAISELETYLRLVPQNRDADQIREIVKELRAQAAKK